MTFRVIEGGQADKKRNPFGLGRLMIKKPNGEYRFKRTLLGIVLAACVTLVVIQGGAQ